jgi:FkbM family methyltransferase
MLKRVGSSLAYRLKWASLGVYYTRSLHLRDIRVGGRKVRLSIPEAERAVQEHEFGKIVFDDCYRLRDVNKPVRTILDIGANIGLFAIAARRFYPNAIIQCYEPNPNLERHLSAHCSAIGADYRMMAVGSVGGTVSLLSSGDSLYCTSEMGGSIPQIGFDEAVAQLGIVDIVKLDCEGAEWDIFADPEPWARVRSLVMEYHLWARPGLTVEGLRNQLTQLGFSAVDIAPADDPRWGLAMALKPNI